ncbi:MAG: quinone-dependent dihydroorotate dehydrogenase [Gammaproteobacteria bacterium]|nr:quinone-dependent dihydroorotate dehydrogenase [Gammaproteobacteria bacterium]
MNFYPLARKLLFLLEPETAHTLSLRLLDVANKLGLLKLFIGETVKVPVKVMGIEFINPIGLAAGLDKNGEHIDALAACGFGFVEIGTVTPKAQPGNPKPRLFRLEADEAIINRMGFNNNGVEALVNNVRRSRRRCVLGINIGKNRDTALQTAADDYRSALTQVYPHADYVTINISSPNTPGLRDLQHGEELAKLLATLKQEQTRLADIHGKYVPLVVKIAPDLDDGEIAELAQTFLQQKIDGVIATNTTNSREGLRDLKQAAEQGGLSGRPLRSKSDHVLATLVSELKGQIPVIAAGGVFSAGDAKRKMELGASLVQIYTGFIYQGPALIKDCAERTAELLKI